MNLAFEYSYTDKTYELSLLNQQLAKVFVLEHYNIAKPKQILTLYTNTSSSKNILSTFAVDCIHLLDGASLVKKEYQSVFDMGERYILGKSNPVIFKDNFYGRELEHFLTFIMEPNLAVKYFQLLDRENELLENILKK